MSQAETDPTADQRGIALVGVLWLLLVLSVIAAGSLRNTRTEIDLVRNGLEIAEARAAADAAVQRAVLAVTASEPEAGWPRDGTAVTWRFGGSEIRIAIQDEAGKIDLNQASPLLLKGLFLAAGVEDEAAVSLAAAVADFRDQNDLRRLNGAEDKDYLQAGYPRGAKDSPFARIAELRQVFGMSPEVFGSVASAVTVYSGRAAFDPQTASRIALLAVPDSDPIAVDNFLEERARLSRGGSLSGQVLQPPSVATGVYSSDGVGRVFGVRAEARRTSGVRFVRTAVVRKSSLAGAPFKLEQWGTGTDEFR